MSILNSLFRGLFELSKGLILLALDFGIRIAMIVGLIFGVVYFTSDTNKNIKNEPKEVFSKPILTTPVHGYNRWSIDTTRVGSLEIKTSSGRNYLVKLIDAITDKPVMDVFMHGGKYTNIRLPLGSYKIRYAVGSDWYGYEYYFGPSTNYSKADTVMTFEDNNNSISSYTLTLYNVSNGNLSTTNINRSEF
ncbi:hypothetical protein GLP31_05625 [Photobacterium carnosum]|uniref:hypothetical protein n=1 Tax=Photobacterium carnosum TaxID=2023717 RepID=UPI001E314A7E|nr:hypothetical protein [Photobacterium carnosum]MCD9551955.1 hypothetical protein [Photobacterium carnosum]